MMQSAIATLGDDYHTDASTHAHTRIIISIIIVHMHVASEGFHGL